MAESKAFHEDFGRDDGAKAGSERGFGIVFAVVFVIIGLWPLWDGGPMRLWALIVAGAFLAAGLFAPAILRPFYGNGKSGGSTDTMSRDPQIRYITEFRKVSLKSRQIV